MATISATSTAAAILFISKRHSPDPSALTLPPALDRAPQEKPIFADNSNEM